MLRMFMLYVTCCLLSFRGNAADVVVLDQADTAAFFSVTQHAVILEDERHELSLGDLLENRDILVQKGIRLKRDVVNLDFTSSSWWVNFTIRNKTDKTKNFLLETARPLTNRADLYTVFPDGTFQQLVNGDGIRFDQREIEHRKLVFPITFQPNEELEFFLHLSSDGEVITLPIRLWTERGFNANDYKEQYILGFYFGMLLFVIIIYFFFYLALREISFFYYVIYVFCLGLFQLSIDGLAFQYLWPGSPWLGNHIVLISACLSVIFVQKYAQLYLKTKTKLPKINKVFNVFYVLAFLCLILSFTGGKVYATVFPAVNTISLGSTIFILITIGSGINKKLQISPFFAAAFIFLIAGAIVFILSNFNLIENSLFTEHALKLGSALEVICLSITMAGKYREIQMEKEKAQAETLEKLEEMNRLKDEINIELEKQVKERTAEINQQKEELAEKNKDITDSINYARRIQEAILPPDELVNKYLPENFILYHPKDIVAGDFYWMEALPPDKNEPQGVLFAASDCTGHGVPGAMVSVVCHNALNRSVREFGLNRPSEILDKVRELVIEQFTVSQQAGEKSEDDVQDGMDIALCRLIYRQGKPVLEYSGANNPLWIISKEEKPDTSSPVTSIRHEESAIWLHEVKPDKQPIGLYEYQNPFTHHVINLEPSDLVYTFTDGYPDQFGGDNEAKRKAGGKKFKSKHFKELILSVAQSSMNGQKSVIVETLERWKGELPQNDDICVIGIRV